MDPPSEQDAPVGAGETDGLMTTDDVATAADAERYIEKALWLHSLSTFTHRHCT
eukprot:COSAG02_NODE_10553_length_1915_cov_3.033590_1_plen_53_part_10